MQHCGSGVLCTCTVQWQPGHAGGGGSKRISSQLSWKQCITKTKPSISPTWQWSCDLPVFLLCLELIQASPCIYQGKPICLTVWSSTSVNFAWVTLVPQPFSQTGNVFIQRFYLHNSSGTRYIHLFAQHIVNISSRKLLVTFILTTPSSQCLTLPASLFIFLSAPSGFHVQIYHDRGIIFTNVKPELRGFCKDGCEAYIWQIWITKTKAYLFLVSHFVFHQLHHLNYSFFLCLLLHHQHSWNNPARAGF